MNNNQKIKCHVSSCQYQDCNCCTLTEIQVGCSDQCQNATNQERTVCKSFKCDKKNSTNS